MAEAAHVTETTSGRPSLFELIAADGLFSSLHPAVKHVCMVVTARYPRMHFWLERYFDELFLLVNAFVQSHYLCTCAGSLAEHFYGIKRVPLSRVGVSQKPSLTLSPPDVYRNLIWLCALPYIKTRLDKLFEDLDHDHAGGIVPRQRWRRRAHQLFLRLYPVLHASCSISVAFYHLAYMLDKVQQHSPLTRLAGVHLHTLTADDFQLIEQRRSQLASWSALGRRRLPVAVALFALHAATRIIGQTLEVGSFFVQFLDWWRRDSGWKTSRLGRADVPAPPADLLTKADSSPDHCCPLCGSRRTCDAVLAVSGHVFCHVCVFRYVSEKGRCPVTWYPANTDQIYKLYPPDW